MSKVKVFQRLGDIPDIGYTATPVVHRTQLPRHNDRPRISSFVDGGRRYTSISWDLPKGISTSESPASERAHFDESEASPSIILRRLSEALELPGTASDYYFAIFRAFSALWDRRRHKPEILPEVERLCLLNIKLVEVWPSVLRLDDESEGAAFNVMAFDYLIRIYEREGFIQDALEIARRGSAIGQRVTALQRLEERFRDLHAESIT